MKTKLLSVLLLVAVMYTMNSCSTDASEVSTVDNNTVQKVVNYSYSESEIETMKLINEYRVSVGLNPLEKINHISYKSEEHDYYMINNNVVNHNDFVARSENIMKVLGAKTVSENIAYNYSTPQAALNAWLASPGHKENIEGDFTHFGISIRENPVTGKKYYTNIFAKI
jgi:uncharacterized protein YkwD